MGIKYTASLPVDDIAQAVRMTPAGVVEAPSYWDVRVVNTTGATVVFAGACIYGGYRVLAAAGAFTLDVYDNASTASGQRVEAGISVNTPGSGMLANGIKCDNGVVADMSGNPTDGLILVFYRGLV